MIEIEYNRETNLFTAYYNGTMLAYNSDLKRLYMELQSEADEIENLIKAENYVG